MPPQIAFRFRWLDSIRHSGFRQSGRFVGETTY